DARDALARVDHAEVPERAEPRRSDGVPDREDERHEDEQEVPGEHESVGNEGSLAGLANSRCRRGGRTPGLAPEKRWPNALRANPLNDRSATNQSLGQRTSI